MHVQFFVGYDTIDISDIGDIKIFNRKSALHKFLDSLNKQLFCWYFGFRDH